MGKVDVTGSYGDVRQLDTEKAGIGLERDCADNHAPQTEHACIRESLDNGSCQPIWLGQASAGKRATDRLARIGMGLRTHRAVNGGTALWCVNAQIPFRWTSLWGRRLLNVPVVLAGDSSFSEG